MPTLSLLQVLSFVLCTLAVTWTYRYIITGASPPANTNDFHIANISPMTTTPAAAARTLSKAMASSPSSRLSSAKIVPRRSSARGHADHGWLNTYHTFSFADYYDRAHMSFGSLRVLNEDRVAPGTGFPTHPHRDAEIFSYILSGQLTHRDSMTSKGHEVGASKDQFYRMERGDVQFTTGGTGIAHSEANEDPTRWVHFLQIWATPWRRSLTPTYHTLTFPESDKRNGFLPIISPLAAGQSASPAQDAEAKPTVDGTIPVHADLLFSAGIIPAAGSFEYTIGGASADAVFSKKSRKAYVHLPMTKGGKAKIRLDGRDDAVLNEGDGAYVTNVDAGQVLMVESVGGEEAEVVVLDSN